ncbi:MAG: hypothetical protein FJ088_14115, partial [Deltaproteobacteria bacterium]|nr:hypothetical protein [Deltaproteobacteria bacterium]
VNRYNSPGGLPSGTVFNYNDIYPVGSGAKAGNIDGTNYNTLANWKTATGQDTYSISSNPQFIDAAAKNFQLKSVSGGYPSNSPAINMGKNLAEVQIDFLGKARPLGTSTDIGAYEYP